MNIKNPTEFKSLVGTYLGHSEWRLVTQSDVDLFARVTQDNQWIHTDPILAKKSTYGHTIVQGFLTLALAPGLVREIITVENYSMKINYGLNNVRFPAPFQVGRQVRMHLELLACTELEESIETTMFYRFENRDLEKPVCVAEQINRWF